MAYSDFSADDFDLKLGLTVASGLVFDPAARGPVPAWLAAQFALREPSDYVTEKSKSESVVWPLLKAACLAAEPRAALFSGLTVNVDPAKGLAGEIDFLMALAPAVMPLRSPIAAVVEAKKGDIDLALGQCAAQMVGAREFNARRGVEGRPVWGCITNAEAWQFYRLDGSCLVTHSERLPLEPARVLGAFLAILAEAAAWRPPVPAGGTP